MIPTGPPGFWNAFSRITSRITWTVADRRRIGRALWPTTPTLHFLPGRKSRQTSERSLRVWPETAWSTKPMNRSVAWAVSNSTVEKIGMNQVRIHLTRPYPAFLQSIAFTVGSVVEKACAGTWDYWGVRNDILDRHRDCGTGPFELNAWVPNQVVVLDRFDGYWGTPAPLGEVRIEKANDIVTREYMLLSGDADY